MADNVKILGTAGSIRKASFNRSALHAAQKLAPEGASIEIFEIDGLPGFNQDDEKNPSAKVTELKAKILGVRFGAVLSKRAMNCTPTFHQGHRFFQSRVKTSQYRLAGASVLIPVHPLVEK